MKNRIYIILGLLLLNSVFSFGQTSKIEIGGFVEPNYSMIKLKKQNNDEITQLFYDSFKKHSEYKFGYDFGITISYVFKGKLLFFTGVNYSNKGYKDRYNTDDFIFLDPEPELPNKVIVNRNYYYIGVPLLFGYRFDIEGKIKPQIRFGIINNFYMNYSERITQIYEDKKEKELRKPDILSLESEKYLIDYYLGTGINYKINDIIDIEFEIVYKDLINEVAPQSDLQIKFYNIGLKTGLRIKIPTHNI